jgi:hypothetical protein
VTKRKGSVLAIDLPDGERPTDVARILADFLGRAVVIETPDGEKVTIEPQTKPKLDH